MANKKTRPVIGTLRFMGYEDLPSDVQKRLQHEYKQMLGECGTDAEEYPFIDYFEDGCCYFLDPKTGTVWFENQDEQLSGWWNPKTKKWNHTYELLPRE